ncbi:hypothetical protein T459_34795 [Capsicum annuum]|uniref:Disease resistance N-terminal domain-containing protein n=2 Tax=Capsicum annuum TaxID=4072 RepID=A0A2G2XV53_CAPAN|nr:hypothetical protein T459_34795 [Capsicum annuum]
MLAFSLERTITSTVVCDQTTEPSGRLGSINNHSARSTVEFLGTVIQESCGTTKGVSLTSGIGGIPCYYGVKTLECYKRKQLISGMDIGLAVGGAFLSSALNVLFDRLAPHGELLKMFQKNKHDVGLLERLEDILLGLQIVLSDAENKQASDPLVRKWLNKLQRAVDGAENLLEEVNYEALGLKVEGQHQNLVETSNHQVSDLNLSLSDDIFLNIEEKLKDTITKLEVFEKQIGRLGLQKHFDSGKKIETRTPSTSLIDESDVFGRQNEIDEFIDRLLSKDASEKSPTVVPIVGMGAWAR